MLPPARPDGLDDLEGPEELEARQEDVGGEELGQPADLEDVTDHLLKEMSRPNASPSDRDDPKPLAFGEAGPLTRQVMEQKPKNYLGSMFESSF